MCGLRARIALCFVGILASAVGFSAESPWQPGKHYEVLAQPRATTVGRCKIEVIEFLLYPCSHCNELEPFVAQWRKELPKHVVFVRVPVVYPHPVTRAYAQLHYGLESLERSDLHAAVFDAIHKDSRQVVSANAEEANLLLSAFARRNSIEPVQLISAFNSPTTLTAAQNAQTLTQTYKIHGTPSFIVAGRFRVVPNTEVRDGTLLSIVNDLIANKVDTKGCP